MRPKVAADFRVPMDGPEVERGCRPAPPPQNRRFASLRLNRSPVQSEWKVDLQ
jgi:hypothetical protein